MKFACCIDKCRDEVKYQWLEKKKTRYNEEFTLRWYCETHIKDKVKTHGNRKKNKSFHEVKKTGRKNQKEDTSQKVC
jgi:hypothetical protein